MDGFYPGRGQTQAKHAILQRYLEVFAFKVGTTFGSFDFIDGFSGPWQERDKEAFWSLRDLCGLMVSDASAAIPDVVVGT